MIAEKDIQHVRGIIKKTQEFATTEKEKKKFEDLLNGFNDAADRYLKEVKNNDRLQQYN